MQPAQGSAWKSLKRTAEMFNGDAGFVYFVVLLAGWIGGMARSFTLTLVWGMAAFVIASAYIKLIRDFA